MTVKINLLPWRQELREELKKQFLIILGAAALLSFLVVGSVHFYYQSLIDSQLSSNRYLKKEIKKLDKRIKQIKNIRKDKERLMARMEVIQQLQRDRPTVVRLFDSLVRVVPSGVNYSSLKRRKNTLMIDGSADSNTRVSKLMRNMENSEVLKDPSLTIIREGDSSKREIGKFFSLKAKLEYQKE